MCFFLKKESLMAGCALWIPAVVASGSLVRYAVLLQAVSIVGTALQAVECTHFERGLLLRFCTRFLCSSPCCCEHSACHVFSEPVSSSLSNINTTS